MRAKKSTRPTSNRPLTRLPLRVLPSRPQSRRKALRKRTRRATKNRDGGELASGDALVWRNLYPGDRVLVPRDHRRTRRICHINCARVMGKWVRFDASKEKFIFHIFICMRFLPSLGRSSAAPSQLRATA
jgi:hypothetical protein